MQVKLLAHLSLCLNRLYPFIFPPTMPGSFYYAVPLVTLALSVLNADLSGGYIAESQCDFNLHFTED